QQQEAFGVEDLQGSNSESMNNAPEQSNPNSSSTMAQPTPDFVDQQQQQQPPSYVDRPDSNKNEQTENKKKQRPDPNPFRSLGNVLQEWKKRLNVVEEDENSNESHQEKEKPEKDSIDDGEFNYMKDDDESKEDNQTLAPATEQPEDMGEKIEEKEDEVM